MNIIAYDQIIILLFQCIIIAAMLLGLFKLRSIFGLSLLFTTLGVFQYIQVFLISSLYIQVTSNILISPGTIFFTGSLFAILLIYIREDALEARKVIYAIVFANLVLSLMQVVISFGLDKEGVLNIYNLPQSFFTQQTRVIIIGTLVLFVDVFIIIFLFEKISKFISNLFFRIFFSMALVLSIDSVLFTIGVHAGSDQMFISLMPSLISKTAAAFIFSVIFTLYLIYIDKRKIISESKANSFKDLFHTLTYRQKYEDVVVEKEQQQEVLKKSKEELLLAQDFIIDSIENMTDGFVSLNNNWVYTNVNKRAAKMFGKKPEDLVGKHIWTEFPEAVGQPHYQHYYKAIETQQTVVFEEYYKPWDKWFENRVIPSKDGISVFFQDITDRIKTREEIRVQKEYSENLIKSMQQGLLVVNANGEHIDVNSKFCEMSGFTKEDIIGTMPPFPYWPPEEIDNIQSEFKKTLDGELGTPEFIFMRKNGERFSVSLTTSTIKDDNGIPQMFFANVEDITDRIKTQKEMVDLNQKLASTVAKLDELSQQLKKENVYLRTEIDLAFNYEEMVYGSEVFSNVLTEIEKVAPTNATVLLLGESGTGKELLARAIHNTSLRNNKPLIKINCAAIPRELIESELFGHKKGAFTGAVADKVGKFELANGGTLFLDELGEMPLEMQPKLLRFLQEGEIEVVGGSKTQKLDVRIIVATNKDLKEEIKQKRFREDLFFRINVFPIIVPALRERPEDIPLLVEHFINKFSKEYGKNIKYISDLAMQEFQDYQWPGNIRELENLIERAVILSNTESLMLSSSSITDSADDKERLVSRSTLTLNDVQRNHIFKTLEKCNWKVDGENGASKILDIKPSTLRDRMKKLGIKKSTKK